MVEPVTGRHDITRPLDECEPVSAPASPPLRPAVPDPSGWDPADERTAARLAAVSAAAGPVPRPAGPVLTGASGRDRPAAGGGDTDAVAGHPEAGHTGPGWGRYRRWITGALVAPWRGVRAVAAWSRRPSGRLVVPSAVVAVLVAAAATTSALLMPPPAATGGTGGANGAEGGVSPGAAAPAAPPVGPGVEPGPPLGLTGRPADVLRGWAQRVSPRTGIPVVAMQAYGYAELVVTETTPGCHLSWTTLAAIGRAESNHGSTGPSTLQSDGRAWPQILGPALDGGGDRKLIRDTDQGRLDGDPVYDRAVGPMQFLPQTWQAERVDASGDGVADPHNIHDAALAAANYLCRGGRDLATAEGWWAAVLAYNDVQVYAQQVFQAANDYGRRSR